ncbi:hypothetical protein V1477_010044 [Vespula maculifrons]|uniref:Uncharacterized protein n=1 Tax=Vespula maculifrons TaxID=7453 RepID=A0ABD2CBH7_VESMC
MQPLRAPVVLGDWKSLLSLSQIALLDCLVTSSYSGHLGSVAKPATRCDRASSNYQYQRSSKQERHPLSEAPANCRRHAILSTFVCPQTAKSRNVLARCNLVEFISIILKKSCKLYPKFTSPPPSTPPSPPSPYAWRRRLPKYPLESYWKSLNR